MESSRRAVEAYRRTRLIDGVTADDDKVAPVYKLDEVSDVLRTSSYDIVRELVEYIFRRLDHKSPIVKQKTLRVLKFTVGKSGNEFKREIQRQSGVIKQLFHYRGQPDPLRGDSLNVAVRDTAREAISAIFSSDEKSPIMEETSKRIQGFGSNNFDGRSQQPEKKTILSEVVGLGTASIKQGINLITQLNQYSNSHYTQNNGMGSNSTGNYEAPKFRKSLSDRDSYRDSSTYLTRRDDVYRSHRGWNDEEDSHSLAAEVHTSAEQDGSRGEDNEGGVMSEEEKLLENVTPPGGVRLQPSRDSVTSFLLEAQKLNPENLHYAFHKRLQAHSWQIRFKALCFLEAVMRQRDIAQFKEVCEVFERDSGSISECVESPQVSLREKAKKVLSMLESPHSSSAEEMKAEKSFVQLPDLMDTGDSEGLNLGIEELSVNHSLLGSITTDEEDPFSGLAIHPTTAVTATPATATATATVTVTATPAVTTTVTTTSTIVDPFFMVNENENGSGNGNDGLFEGLSVSSKKEEASLVDLLDAGGTDDHHHQQQQQQPLISSSSSRSNQLNSSFNNFTAHQQTFQSLLQHPQQQQQQQQQQQLKTAFDSFKGYEQQTFQRVPQQQMHMHQMQMQMGGMYGDGFDFSATRYPSSSSTSSSMMMMMSHDKKEDTKAFDFIADHVSAARTKK